MWALWALPALLRSGLCPPAVWVVPHQLTSQNFPCLMGSHEAKKPPANSPPSDLSILKSAASSPVQHHSLPQTHLMPLQLWGFFCLSGLAASTAAPGLLYRAQTPRAGTLTAKSPGMLQHFPKAIPKLILGESLGATRHGILLSPPSPFSWHLLPLLPPTSPFRHQKLFPGFSQSFLLNKFLLAHSLSGHSSPEFLLQPPNFLLPPSPPRADNHHHLPSQTSPFLAFTPMTQPSWGYISHRWGCLMSL